MAKKRPPNMSRYEAEVLLGLTGSYSYKDFQKAYRIAVKMNHPDAGGDAATMVKINQAKDVFEYYFSDDKSQVFTRAVSQESSAAEQAAEEDAYWQEQEQAEAAKRQQDAKDKKAKKEAAWQEAVEFAREHGIKFGFRGGLNPDRMTEKQRDYYSGMITGSWITYQNMFSPTRMGFDLRNTSQSEWREAEWASFKSFKVPDIEYGNNDTPGTFAYWYFQTPVDDWGFGLGYYPKIKHNLGDTISEWENENYGVWRLDDIDTADWTEDDWFYFWYANFNAAEPLVVNGVQYAHVNSRNTHHLHGPWAQREKAQADPNYKEKQKAYWHSNHSKFGKTDGFAKAWVFTPFGDAQIEGDHLIENVGVPFAYATADLYTWHTFNNEYLEGTPPADAANINWSGLEFLRDEDVNAPWIANLGLQDDVAQVAQRKEEKKAQEKKKYAKGIAEWTWIAQHPRISAWLFVLLVYVVSETLAGAWAYSTGNPESVIFTVFAVEVISTLIAIIFKGKVIRWVRKIQRRVFGKA